MAVALAYPNPEKGGRGKKTGLNPEFIGTDASYINKARFVLRNCRDKAEEVLRNAHYPPNQRIGRYRFSPARSSASIAANTHRGTYLLEAPSINAALELLSDKEPTEQQGELIDGEVERLAPSGCMR